MRILYVTQTFPPEPGSTQRPLKQAAWLRRLGHEVTVLTSMPSFPLGRVFPGYRGRLVMRERLEGVDVVRIPSLPAANRGLVRRTLSQLSFAAAATLAATLMRRHDLVIASVPYLMTETACLVAGRLRRSRVLLELRDLVPDNLTLVGLGRESLVFRLLDGWFRFVCRRVDLVAVPYERAAAMLAERGVAAERILMLPHAADAEQLDAADGREVRRRFGLEEKFVVLYAGSFSRYYGVPGLVRAAMALRRRGERIHLVLVGTGPEAAAARDLVRREGLDNVTLVGGVAPGEVGAYLQAADLFINPLVGESMPPYYHGQPTTKLCEYLMVGRPVVAVESQTVWGEFLERIGAGLGVAAGDAEALAEAIASFAAHPDQAAECGRRARSYAREHLERGAVVAAFERELLGRLRAVGGSEDGAGSGP